MKHCCNHKAVHQSPVALLQGWVRFSFPVTDCDYNWKRRCTSSEQCSQTLHASSGVLLCRRYAEVELKTKQHRFSSFFYHWWLNYWSGWGEKGNETQICATMRGVEGKNVLLCHWYLFIILQLIIQDDSIWLVRLGPGEGDAVHSTTDLVHYGYCWWSCEETKTRMCQGWDKTTSTALEYVAIAELDMYCKLARYGIGYLT